VGDEDGSEGEGVGGDLHVVGAEGFSPRFLTNAEAAIGLGRWLIPRIDGDGSEEQVECFSTLRLAPTFSSP
jgi:hypothetical protein